MNMQKVLMSKQELMETYGFESNDVFVDKSNDPMNPIGLFTKHSRLVKMGIRPQSQLECFETEDDLLDYVIDEGFNLV